MTGTEMLQLGLAVGCAIGVAMTLGAIAIGVAIFALFVRAHIEETIKDIDKAIKKEGSND